ncbi:sugar-binding transcriptional regulator [Roseibium sp. RKSG952]|uniref:sugar-binding transcriptional regulator n=1 Tax=Roseibium sp. RKSG952 TaxID=2529384 RepID=UPI0012BD77B4|nr:sugar-binding transcriptional regulator [Roseibium sp. RKSG952]MTH97479.1 sugar-binding transcriptional regulator [Roseibium sp. RKSG952]
MQARDNDWTNYLAIRAAWLSFIGGQTQGEIASRMGMSPAKVHRLIAHAQREGFVKFTIEGRPVECLEMEDELSREYSLTSCIIAPDLGSGEQAIATRAVASLAAHVLESVLTSDTVQRVGVGMGRTLKAAVEAMPRIARQDLEIMSICGSLTRTLAANPYDVVQKLQERTGGEGYYLPVPYFAENRDEKDVFLSQRSVQDLIQRARQSNVFIVGIGSVDPEGHLIERGMISGPEQVELAANGAVCDLMGRFLALDGSLVATGLGDCAVGLHFEDVRGARVIALAGGESKAEATLAALRAGVITDLIADETLVRAMRAKIGKQLVRSA